MNAPHDTVSTAARLSRRAESLGTENAFVVLAEVNALVRQGKDIVSFCIGQPDFPTPPNIQEAGIAAIKEGKHGYTPSAGIDELRAAAAKDIGARRGLDFLPEDVVVGAGAKPFIAYTIASVTDYGAGDEVIYPVPGFPIYESQILANGAVPVPIYLRESRDFAFDPAELEAKITPQTKLLILNTPHNPTGGMLQAADLDAIAAILARHPQVWVFADEIYSRLAYAGRFDTLATRPGMLQRTIICDGASKTWAMTGWRIGFAANRALAPVFTRWITNTDSCASQISQWAAVEAITGPQDAADAMRASFLERRDLIVGLLNAVPGVTLQGARRRVLRVAERHRGLLDHRLRRLGGVPQAAARRSRRGGARRHPFRPPRSGRRPAHPLFVCRIARTDQERHRPHRRVRAPAPEDRDADAGLARRQPVRARRRAGARPQGARQDGRSRRRAGRGGSATSPRIGTVRDPTMPADLPGGSSSARPTWRAPSSASAIVGDDSDGGRALSRRAAICPPELAAQNRTRGVCWPEFADLDWSGAGLAIEARPTLGDDRLGITGTFCAIAETGTLVVLSGADTPTATTLLPDTHVAVVRAERIVSGMEEAFALIRRERGQLPRAVNMISGPSRTGDIEQTIVLGAHGPYRVHILVVG